MTALQILIGIYSITLIINILIAMLQFFNDRNPAQRAILFYWIGHLISTAANGLFLDEDMKIVSVASLGTFLTTYFLGSFFSKIHDVKVSIHSQLVFFLICYLISWLLYLSGTDFVYYATIAALGCVSPLPTHIYKVLKYKARALTLTQKIFVGCAGFMTLHWLDYGYFHSRPELLFVGFCIALAIIHILSILTPIMGTEFTLQRQNDQLEDQMKLKVQQLTSAELSLWESNKLASLGQLSGGVAHEINNPLQVINLHTDNLKSKAEKGEITAADVIQGTNRIEKMIDRISQITESLRRIARDHRTVDMQENDLVHIVQDTMVLCNDKIISNKIYFTMDLPQEPLKVKCNSVEISQIVLNLLNNSIDAVENLETKSIAVTLKQTENTVTLTVEDSGQISPNVVPHLMEPFYTTKAFGKGTGLGLSIAKSIADNHGANLYYDKTKAHTAFVLEFEKKPKTL